MEADFQPRMVTLRLQGFQTYWLPEGVKARYYQIQQMFSLIAPNWCIGQHSVTRKWLDQIQQYNLISGPSFNWTNLGQSGFWAATSDWARKHQEGAEIFVTGLGWTPISIPRWIRPIETLRLRASHTSERFTHSRALYIDIIKIKMDSSKHLWCLLCEKPKHIRRNGHFPWNW